MLREGIYRWLCLHTQNHLYTLPELNTKLNTKLFTYHSFELVWAHLNTFCFSPPQSTMSDVSPGEEFVSSLGADQSIRITVRPVATVHNTRTAKLGGAKTNTITYTHTSLVKNTRSDSVNIKVSEQVPLSTDDRIKVQQLSSQLVFASTFIQCHTATS